MKSNARQNIFKKILIFGSSGQLGSDLFNELKINFDVTGCSSKVDITIVESVEKIISKVRPGIIINAAAYTKVEEAESNPEIAYKINALGPYYIARAARKANCAVMQISTDYVFDGEKGKYTEDDVPGAINIYGASKLAGEQLVQIACPERFYIIRTSALFGNSKSRQKLNFVDNILAKAESGEKIKVVNDQYMSPTYTVDLGRKISELIIKAAPFGIYHITNSGYCSWYDFASAIIKIDGKKANLSPISTAKSGTKIRRPVSTILIGKALEKHGLEPMPNWKDALSRYLRQKDEKK